MKKQTNHRRNLHKQFMTFPKPIQRQIILRCGYGLLSLFFCMLVLSMLSDWLLIVPLIGLFLISTVHAGMLFQTAAKNRYVVVTGRCVDTTATVFRKRTKSILVETNKMIVQVILKQRTKTIPKGAEVAVYVSENTKVYAKDGIELLQNYIALDVARGKEPSQ